MEPAAQSYHRAALFLAVILLAVGAFQGRGALIHTLVNLIPDRHTTFADDQTEPRRKGANLSKFD